MTLTSEQIDSLPAGPELDALVLVTVCGWRRVYKALKKKPTYIVREYDSPRGCEYIGTEHNGWNEVSAVPDDALAEDDCVVAPVSQTWTDMRLVVDAMHARGNLLSLDYMRICLHRDEPDVFGWQANFRRGGGCIAEAEEAPLAICRAALKACMKLADGEKAGATQ